MLESLKLGIAVGGQHFAMRINVDASAFGLDEKLVEVVQVMAGDENCLALDGMDAQRSGRRCTEGLRVRAVELLKHVEVQFADFEGEAEQLFGGVLFSKCVQQLVDGGVTGGGAGAKHHGVVGVGCNAFQTVNDELFEILELRSAG